MSDLVERLDAEARVLSNLSDPAWQHSTHQVEWFRERSMLMLEASAEIERLRASLSRAEEAEERVARVKQWAEAYPQDIFLPVTPDDLKRADALLREAGISMSAMHGHWARHIVSGIAKIVGADIAGAITDE